MDLSVSPDVEVFWSYLIVLVLGVFVAYRQVATRLEGLKDVWLVGDTWIIFFAYLAVPVGLFWLLDRTDAVKDTSLFAALLVGIGYERILAGADGSLSAPKAVAGFWSPFVAYANRVADKVRNAVRRSDRRMEKRLLARFLADENLYKLLDELARSLSPDIALLDKELAAVDATALGEGAKRERKAGLLYREVRDSDDFLYELKEKALVARNWYLWHAYEIGSKIGALVVLLAAVGAVSYMRHQTSMPELEADYALWRIEKPNASEKDLFRAGRRLEQILQNGEADVAAYALRRIGQRLRAPEPALARIDRLLQIALGSRCTAAGKGAELPALLIGALDTGNADARARIHRALVFLAERQNPAPPASLKDWSPSEGDSVTDLQRRVSQWRNYWSSIPTPAWLDCPKRP
jgi:hypothetical protein